MAQTSSAVDSPQRSLLELTSRPGYLESVFEVVSAIPAATQESDALTLLDAAVHRLGADVGVFVSFVRDDGSHESYRFLLACDAVWCHEYERNGWYANDPWLAHALKHAEPVRGHEVSVSARSQRAVIDLAARFGFVSSVIVPAPASGGLSRVGVLCLGAWQPDYFDDKGYRLLKVAARSLAMELHDWWIDRIKRELIEQARISEEDLALLRHERSNHSTKEIAAALGMSAGSVNSRFQRLTEKLGVPNRRAAAVLAAEYGLI